MSSVLIFTAVFFLPINGNSFDQAVARIYQEKPHLKPVQLQENAPKKQWQFSMNAAINFIALSYALIKIYVVHRTIFKEHVQENPGWISWFCPQSLGAVTKKGRFFVQGCGICCQAFAYKTLAQLLYFLYKSELPWSKDQS